MRSQSPIVKNSIHNSMLEDVPEDQLNEFVTTTILKTKRNLQELATLTKRKLGKKALEFQQQLEEEEQLRELMKERSNQKSNQGRKRKKIEGKKKVSATSNYVLELLQSTSNTRDQHFLHQLMLALREKERQRNKKSNSHTKFREVFSRTSDLIEKFWDEMHVSQEARDKFIKSTFYPETLTNCVFIFDEISRLCHVRSLKHKALTDLEMREALKDRLYHLLKKISQKGGIRNRHDHIGEVVSVIESLRQTSVNLVHAVEEWRTATQIPQIFEWNGKNYFKEMLNDLLFISKFEIKDHMEFPITGNPLLLPDHIRAKAKEKIPDFCPFHEVTTIDGKKIDFLHYFQHLSPEELHRIQEADQIILKEDEYIQHVNDYQLRSHSAIQVQKIVRSFLAKKRVRWMRREKRIRQRHHARYVAKLEEEQRKQKETMYEKKKAQFSVNDDMSYGIDVSQSDLGNIQNPELTIQNDEYSFLRKHKKNGRYKQKLFSVEN